LIGPLERVVRLSGPAETPHGTCSRPENIAILVLAFDKLKRDEILMPELSVYDTKWKSHPTLDDAIALNYDRCTGMAVAQPS